jgi:SAM-dependent methyltransferase
LIGKENHYDWIIASHVIEHTPDLVGFLNECDKLLKEDGVISLVIPDKRYCFDRYRPLSGLAGLIDNHLQKSTYHSPGMAADYFLNVVFRNQQTSWHKDSVGEDKFVHTVEHALKEMASIQKDHTYLDLHAWCFVPHSFRLLMEDLFELKMIHLREVDFHPTQGCEFYVTLGRKGPGPGLSRMDLLTRTDDEIREGLADGSKPSEVPVTKITPPLDQTLAHSPQPSFLSAWLRSFRKARRSS